MSPELNPIAENLNAVLLNISDYQSKLTDITNLFNELFVRIDQNYLNINFLEELDLYPKYPIDFKVIDNVNKYNLVQIYSIVQGELKYLLDSISNDSVLGLKNSMDSLPDTEVKLDYQIQTGFFTRISKELFSSTFYNGLIADKEKQSYLYKTFGYNVPINAKRSSAQYLYTLYTFLIKNLKYCYRLFELIYSSDAARIHENTIFYNSMNNYIQNDYQNLTDGLCKFILEYTYQISAPSSDFLAGVKKNIESEILKLPELFNLIIQEKDSMIYDLINYISKNTYNYIASELSRLAISDEEFTLLKDNTTDNIDEFIESLKSYEIETYNNIYKNHTKNRLRDYMFLVYYYKLKPKKFLNVMQLVLLNYVKQQLIDQDSNVFNFSILKSYFIKLLGTVGVESSQGIDFSKVEEYLINILTPSYVLNVLSNKCIIEFSTRIYLIDAIEDTFNLENKVFNEYIDNLCEVFFNYLKNTVQVDYKKAFYYNKKLILIYILAYLKKAILNNQIFSEQEYLLKNIFTDIISNENYTVNIDIEKMRRRMIQYINGDVASITNIFENLLETSIEKRLHGENLLYFLN